MCILNIEKTSEQSISLIFGSILKGFLKHHQFKREIQDLAENDSIVKSTIALYQEICVELKPTPAKFHYTFNLRDVSKVI